MRSWLNVALYYAKNLPEVKAIVKNFCRFWNFGNSSGLAGQLLKIKDQYECLVKLIEKIESAKYTNKKAVQAI